VRFVRDTVRVTDIVLEILGVFVLVFGADVGMPDRDTVIDSVLDTVTVFEVVGVAGNVVGILERVIDLVGVLVLGADVGMPERDSVTDGVLVFGADVGMPDGETVTDRVLDTVIVVVVVRVKGNVVGMLERVIVFVTDHVASKEGFTVTTGDGVSVTDRVLEIVIVVEAVGVTGKVVGILERVIVLVGDNVAGKEGFTVNAVDGETVTDRVLDTVTVFVVVGVTGKVVGILERVIVLVGVLVFGADVGIPDGETVTDRVLDTVTVFVVVGVAGNVVGILERVGVSVFVFGADVGMPDGETVTDRVLETVIVVVVVGKVVGIAERVGVSVMVLGAEVGILEDDTVTDSVLDTVTVFEVVGVTVMVGIPETVAVMVLGADVGMPDGETENVLDTVTEVVRVTVMVLGGEVGILDAESVPTITEGDRPDAETVSDGLATD